MRPLPEGVVVVVTRPVDDGSNFMAPSMYYFSASGFLSRG
jgi:hypothetical protein